MQSVLETELQTVHPGLPFSALVREELLPLFALLHLLCARAESLWQVAVECDRLRAMNANRCSGAPNVKIYAMLNE